MVKFEDFDIGGIYEIVVNGKPLQVVPICCETNCSKGGIRTEHVEFVRLNDSDHYETFKIVANAYGELEGVRLLV